MRTVALVVLLLLAVTAVAALPESSGVKPVERVIVPEYSEGIVFDHDGNAYISHGKVITQISGLHGEGPPARKTCPRPSGWRPSGPTSRRAGKR